MLLTSTGDRRFNFINIDDLERSWTPPSPKRFMVIFLQFLDAAHISTLNCDEMAGDNLRMKFFSIQRRFQQSKSRPSRFKEAGAGGRQRRLPR